MPSTVSIAALDVGSLARLGWWLHCHGTSQRGTEIDGFVAAVVRELRAGRAVAVGFEAPMFVPLPPESTGLCKQRDGERGRPWSAGSGTAALAIGVQQATYVLTQIGKQVNRRLRVGTDLEHLGKSLDLVVWEAFVTGRAKNPSAADPHVDDARRAVAELRRRLAGRQIVSDVGDTDVLSLSGAAILRSGLSDDIELLGTPCVVVRVPDRA